ncbi:replicative DNA helicase [Candidatus Legionella polyplacis]|uniref:Replicative DNA helicase n=1 Tax=Candidatus Legionella polyplacis TaxID=2005262 RepID=A0ABZ2H0D3_9GAMM
MIIDFKKELFKNCKSLPYSFEAEQGILGGLILDNQIWNDIHLKLCETDFYRNEHCILYRSISELIKKNHPVDIVTLIDMLKSINKLDYIGGESYLFELVNGIPGVTNIFAYVNIVREKSVQRQLIEVANEIANFSYNLGEKNINDLLDFAETKIFSIANQTSRKGGPENIKIVLSKTMKKLNNLYGSNKKITGLSTGLSDLDEKTSGLQSSNFIIVAGRPSMGKTALAMNIAEHVVIQNKKPVLVFSMEMPSDSIIIRMISSLARIDQHKLRTGKLDKQDWPRVISTVNLLSEVPLYIDETPALSPVEIRARSRRLIKDQESIGLIIIDYIQLMKIPGFRMDSRTAEISEISRSLKSLAKELNVPIIALSQLNRSLEQRYDKRPIMSDLRESGAIEQDADIIYFIYRDEVYRENSPDKGIAEIIIAKQRNGPIGKVKVAFLGQYTRFEDLFFNN